MSVAGMITAGQHTAGIYADMTVDGPLIGTLVMIIDRAKNLPNRKTMGKQHPYCAARLGKEARKTGTDHRGGQTPRWDQELRFDVRDSPDYDSLKLSVFNDDKKTDLIGETWIDLANVITPGGGRNDAWHGLRYRDKYAGEIRIEMSYYDSRTPAAPAEGSVFDPIGTGSESRALKRKPLPNTVTASPTASSPGSLSAFGPRDMPRESSINISPTAYRSAATDDPFQHSTPPRSSTMPYGPVDYRNDYAYDDYSQQEGSSYNAMQPDFLPQIPPKTGRASLPMQGHRSSGSRCPLPAPPQRQQNLAHHQSLPDVRLARGSQTQRYSATGDFPLYLNASEDEYDQSFHGTIPEDADPAEGLAPLPTPPRRSQALVGHSIYGPATRILPSPTASAHNSSTTGGRDDAYRQPGRSLPADTPSPRHGTSQTFSAASPTQPSPLRRELPARPADYAHTLRHARSSTFSSPARSEHDVPSASHPPLTRHSVSDPYASVSPGRKHPLAQEAMRRSQSPQTFIHDRYDAEGAQHSTVNTPLYRTQAVSPRHAHAYSISPNAHQYSATGSGHGTLYGASMRNQPTTQRPSPARESVTGHASASGGGMPFSPDSFDVHNPAARSSPLESSTNPQKPFHIPSSPLLGQSQGAAGQSRTSLGSSRDPKDPIRGMDGREIDPSDHLPVDSWAPEPEVKVPCKGYGTSDKGFGPRAAAPGAERPKRTSILGNVRNKLSGSSPTLPEVGSPSGVSNTSPASGRVLRKGRASSSIHLRGQGDVLTEINTNPPVRHGQQRSAGSPQYESPLGYESAGYASTQSSGYREYDYGSSALERELSQIDLGSSRKGMVRQSATTGGGYGGQMQDPGQMQMQMQAQYARYQTQSPGQMQHVGGGGGGGGGGRRSYDGHGARSGYR